MKLLDIRMIRESLCDEVGDLLDVFFHHAAGGDRRSSDTDARWLHRAAGVEGNTVFVDRDAGFIQGVRSVGAVQVFIAEIDEHDVVVSASGADAETVMCETGRDGLGVFHDLLRVSFELRLKCLTKADGFRGDDVHQRATLDTRENLRVDFFRELFFAENDPAARPAQGFVRG